MTTVSAPTPGPATTVQRWPNAREEGIARFQAAFAALDDVRTDLSAKRVPMSKYHGIAHNLIDASVKSNAGLSALKYLTGVQFDPTEALHGKPEMLPVPERVWMSAKDTDKLASNLERWEFFRYRLSPAVKAQALDTVTAHATAALAAIDKLSGLANKPTA